MAGRTSQVAPPTDVSLATLRRVIQQLNAQIAVLQQQIDELKAR